jgi:DNA polymerase delta subunit 2
MDGVVGGPCSTPRSTSVLSPPSSYERFILAKPSYGPQYAQLYFCRLVQQRPAATAAAQAAWGLAGPTLRFADRVQSASSTSDVDAAVVGVVFRDLQAKPSILREYSRNAAELIPLPPARTVATYASGDPGDRIILEDETGRFALDVSEVSEAFRHLVTGFIVAIRGRENKTTGTFKVTDVATMSAAPQPPLPELPNDAFVCIVSGLGLGATGFQGMLAPSALRDPAAISAVLRPHLPVDPATQKSVASPVVQLDRFLTAAAAAVPVSIMPGEHDPANFLLPQQPIHRCLLPSASRESNLHRVPNPYERAMDGRIFLGTSGQNVNDFILYDPDATATTAAALEKSARSTGTPVENEKAITMNDDIENIDLKQPAPCNSDDTVSHDCSSIAIDAMQAMLTNRHLAPTAPDTLGSYPFYERDPFVLESTPHVFFAGNQPAFGTQLFCPKDVTRSMASVDGMDVKSADAEDAATGTKRVRLISVPRFDQSGIAALVNLRTLACTAVHFGDRVLSGKPERPIS